MSPFFDSAAILSDAISTKNKTQTFLNMKGAARLSVYGLCKISVGYKFYFFLLDRIITHGHNTTVVV